MLNNHSLVLEFSMSDRFPSQWNEHYPFDNPLYQKEIVKQDDFAKAGALAKMDPYKFGGGSIIASPWGSNRSIDAGLASTDTVSKYLAGHGLSLEGLLNAPKGHEKKVESVEYCIKDLVVLPGNQLSLQKHQGREEYWMVKKGLLTVIVDGQIVDVPKGQAIFVPCGAVHCMNNCTDEPVAVEELQFGICREQDNVRLVDASVDENGMPTPRPTYPITTEVEYASAVLFAKLAQEIAAKRGRPLSRQLKTLALSLNLRKD